jgi:hypothetical protein
METKIFNVIAAANEVFKANSKNRREFNVSYYSLSRLLKDMQSKANRKISEPLWESLGIEINWDAKKNEERLQPADILGMLDEEQISIDKKGNKCCYIWTLTQSKDEDGNKLFEEDGVTPIMEEKKNRISEGGWTMNKIYRLLAQANAFKA